MQHIYYECMLDTVKISLIKFKDYFPVFVALLILQFHNKTCQKRAKKIDKLSANSRDRQHSAAIDYRLMAT